jgi:hypothetical protein
LVAEGELTVFFLLWVSLYVAAGVLFEQPGAPTWQPELALGVGVFALQMAVLSITHSALGDARERTDRAAEIRQREQAQRAAKLRQRLRDSCRDDEQAGAEA